MLEPPSIMQKNRDIASFFKTCTNTQAAFKK
jgi:hypothetical protein